MVHQLQKAVETWQGAMCAVQANHGLLRLRREAKWGQTPAQARALLGERMSVRDFRPRLCRACWDAMEASNHCLLTGTSPLLTARIWSTVFVRAGVFVGCC